MSDSERQESESSESPRASSESGDESAATLRGVFVRAADGLVYAYRTLDTARAAHPGVGDPVHVTETGARDATSTQFALLVCPLDEPATVPEVSASLDDSLLRTNVQKAVRRQDAAAAKASVLQLIAQRPSKGENAYDKKWLERLAIIAAEDATVVPLLPTAIFHLLGATSLGPAAVDACAGHLADCAAALARAPRDPACASASAAEWALDDHQLYKLAMLQGGNGVAPRENIFKHGWCPKDSAMVLLLGLAARMYGRGGPLDNESRWLASLELAVRTRLERGQPACVAAVATATDGPPVPLGPDGTLLAPEHRLYYSADFHNPKRWKVLQETLVGKDGARNQTALKEAMKEAAYRNVRDAPLVHRLNFARPAPPHDEPWKVELFGGRWPRLASLLWQPEKIAAAAQGKKRAAASAGGSGGKQSKLAFGAGTSAAK